MLPERKAYLKQLRIKLANLTDQEKQALANKEIIATVEGRSLSLHNTLLVYLQSDSHTPTIVGGYQQWRKAGKQVRKGEHGYTIWFPVGPKNQENGDILDAESFFLGTVFDISQVDTIA